MFTFVWLDETHIKTHSNQSEFVCDYPQCNYKTNIKDKFKIDSAKHMATEEFECDWPQFGFKSEYESCLKLHLKIHGVKMI